MIKLKKINDKLYSYYDEESKTRFTLSYGVIGVLSRGDCWRLRCIPSGGDSMHITAFCTHSDGYDIEKECCEGRLWTLGQIVSTAESMIKDFLPEHCNMWDTDMDVFLDTYNSNYSWLYDNNDEYPCYHELLTIFDRCVAKLPSVKEFCKYRGDCISSDREAVAYMLTALGVAL